MTRKSSATDRRVQNSPDGSLSDYTGRSEVVLRWDPHGKFLEFNDGNLLVQHLMVNYSKAKRAHENRSGGLNGILEPHQTLTITGTEADEVTLNRSRYEVVDFFAEVNREVRYVPDWGWVYPSMPTASQENIIDRYVGRVKWFYNKFEELGLDHVEFIPLVKGLHREHYLRAVETYGSLGIDRIGIYGVQTPSLDMLIWRIEQAIEVFDPEGVLVIGRQSPEEVAQLPQRVDGVAGFWNWKQACKLTADGYSSEKLAMWYSKVKEALRNGRTDRQIGLDSPRVQEVKVDGRGR